VPDPQDPATFARSKLDWSEIEKPDHREMLDFHRRLIALRKEHPALSDPWLDHVEVSHGDHFLSVRRGSYLVLANLADHRQRIAVDGRPCSVLLTTEPGVTLMPNGVDLPAMSAAVITYR
jgi:maltooligosyltrehalose trehalohydrolase